MEPLVSVVVVNWNGIKWLKGCLDSLCAQAYPRFEIVIVDNASTDGSVEFIRDNYPDALLIRNDENYGFARACNTGMEHSNGDFILLLNNDTRIEPQLISTLLEAFEEIPNLGSVQPKIVLMDDPDRLDECGDFWTSSTFTYHYGFGADQSLEKYNRSFPVFSNKAACMLVKADVLEKIGMLDEDFWCYYEEVDLCHRLWLSGFECWYYPRTTVHHALGPTSSLFEDDLIRFHDYKNKLRSFLKNFEMRTLLTVKPTFFIVGVGLSIYFLLTGKSKTATSFYRAVWWNIKNARRTMELRRSVQTGRTVSDRDIFKIVKRNPRLSYYRYITTGTGGYDD